MPKERLYQGKRFVLRNGVDQFYWKGMATKPDPEAQPADRPRLVINGRYLGGNIVPRPPLAPKAVDIPLQTGLGMSNADWELAFLGEHHSYAGTKLWWGAEFVSTYTGGSFGYVDTDNDPEHDEVGVYLQLSQAAPVLVYYGGFIYAGATEALRRLYRIARLPGVVNPVPVRLPADEIAISTPGYRITALHVHDGVLYYVKSSATGNGWICSWDGYENTDEQELGSGAASGAAITTFQDKVVVTAAGETDLWYRDSAGAWHDVALTSASGATNSMAQLRGLLYIAGGDEYIYSFNGTTISEAREITAGTAPEGCNCLVTFNERLYYAWKENLGGDSYWPWLGMFDPDTDSGSGYNWEDNYAPLGIGQAVIALSDEHSDGDGNHLAMTPGSVTALTVYRQRIFAAVSRNTADSLEDSKIMTHGVVNNPYSTWYVTHEYELEIPPSGPVYFPRQLAATGNYNERVIRSFKVL